MQHTNQVQSLTKAYISAMTLTCKRVSRTTTLLLNDEQLASYGLQAIDESYFEPRFWQQQQAVSGQASGRGTSWFVRATPECKLVLRHYCRGGLVGRINRDWFAFERLLNTRPYQELSLLQHMHRAGLNVPIGLAGRVRRKGLGYTADLLTVFIEGAVDLHAYLTQKTLSLNLWQAIGREIARMHSAQVYHHDLNIRNIMLDAEQRVWIIDFDKCRLRTGHKWKAQNLARLQRSLQKELNITPSLAFDHECWTALMAGYAQPA